MTFSNTSKADLHLRTKYSRRAADWLLRKLNFPASYTDPQFALDKLRDAGMQFFTFTDENTIEGCLEIAHEPGAFLSEEVVAAFPEDGCRIHLLVWGITESQHREIQQARENIYDLQAYLAEQKLAHAVGHPLHSIDEKLTTLHFQKLILLFQHFEGINGRYNSLLSEAVSQTLSALTPESIERAVAATGLEAIHEKPWIKTLIGGSDDNGGVFPGRAWTETSKANSVEEFLKKIRDGKCEAKGKGGTPILMAHGTYSTVFDFAKAHLSKKPNDPGVVLLEKIFTRFLEGQNPTEFSLGEKIGFFIQGVTSGKILDLAKPNQKSLWKELAVYFTRPEVQRELAEATKDVKEPEQRAFLMANIIANQLGYRFFTQFISLIHSGKFLESIQMITPLIPIIALLGPYYHAFKLPSREFLRKICQEVSGSLPECLSEDRRAWLTDTLEDINGVSTTIRRMTAAGVEAGNKIEVLTSRSEITIKDVPIKNFPPIGEFALPEYELQRLSFPPVLEVLKYIEENCISELIISTPGPIGLTGVLAAKLLGLKSASIYHTDFPQYVGILTDDSFMQTLTWTFMHWFYSQQELIYVNSEDYRKSWMQRGIPENKLRILPRGLETDLFHPKRSDKEFWKSYGLQEGETAVLYVGRISKEKNLDILVAASREIERSETPIRFLFVGDGPYLPEMKKLLPTGIFTGYLKGENLAKAYASADIFVFPSTTDTFGNVILEAQASATPCIVTDMGGPRDLVENNQDGIIVRALDVRALASAILRLACDETLRSNMGIAARKRVENRDWASAFEQFWSGLASGG
ncbi:MAG: glycosyltransferase [Chthoniobacterales bacterium]